jgi:hypothetical protein
MKNKDWYTSLFLRAANLEVTTDLIKECSKKWWWNTRSKNHGGLRLTDEGIDFVKEQADLKSFEISLPKEYHPTAQTLIWLDQYLESPFYLNKRTITVIEERAAFELYLFSGDIRKFGYNRALNKRMIQD